MRLRLAAVVAGLAVRLTSGAARATTVEYVFTNNPLAPGQISFDFGAASYVTTDLKIAGSAAACAADLFQCQSIAFTPASTPGSSDIVTVTLQAYDPSAPLVPVSFAFSFGTFLQPGLHTGLDGSELTILASVPLPSSAPMLGAALLALGALGFVLDRRAAATG